MDGLLQIESEKKPQKPDYSTVIKSKDLLMTSIVYKLNQQLTQSGSFNRERDFFFFLNVLTCFPAVSTNTAFSSFSTFKTSDLYESEMAIKMYSRATAGGFFFHPRNPTKPLTAGQGIQVLWYNLLTDWRP